MRVNISNLYCGEEMRVWVIVVGISIFPILTVLAKIWTARVSRYTFTITARSDTIACIRTLRTARSTSKTSARTISLIITVITIERFHDFTFHAHNNKNNNDEPY